MNSNEIILKVDHLGHQFRSRGANLEVLCDVNFEIAAGQMVVVHGDSGSGKTTLLLDCGAMQNPTSGQVNINQQPINVLSPIARNQFRAKHIGYLFQTLQLVPYLTLLENIRLVKGVDNAIAERWLERLGLADRRDHKPESLSHGQRQRAALARAIAHRPSLLIADEPTGNLDPDNTQLVFGILREFADQGSAVLVATHESSLGLIADDVYRIQSETLINTKGE